jgi:hypothetical protein
MNAGRRCWRSSEQREARQSESGGPRHAGTPLDGLCYGRGMEPQEFVNRYRPTNKHGDSDEGDRERCKSCDRLMSVGEAFYVWAARNEAGQVAPVCGGCNNELRDLAPESSGAFASWDR